MDEKAELLVDFLIIFLLAIRNRERGRGGWKGGDHCLKPSGLYKIVSYVLFYLYLSKTQGEVRGFIVVFILQIRRTPEIVSALPRVTLSSSKEKPDRLTVFGSMWLSFSHFHRRINTWVASTYSRKMAEPLNVFSLALLFPVIFILLLASFDQ